MTFYAQIYPHIPKAQIREVHRIVEEPMANEDDYKIKEFDGVKFFEFDFDEPYRKMQEELHDYLKLHAIPCHVYSTSDYSENGFELYIDAHGNVTEYEIDADHCRVIVDLTEKLTDLIDRKNQGKIDEILPEHLMEIDSHYKSHFKLKYEDFYNERFFHDTIVAKHLSFVSTTLNELNEGTITEKVAFHVIERSQKEMESKREEMLKDVL